MGEGVLEEDEQAFGEAQLEKMIRFDSQIVANYFNSTVPSGSSPAIFVIIAKMTNFTFKQMAKIQQIAKECFKENNDVLLSLPAVDKWMLDDLVDIDDDLRFSRTDADITNFKDQIAEKIDHQKKMFGKFAVSRAINREFRLKCTAEKKKEKKAIKRKAIKTVPKKWRAGLKFEESDLEENFDEKKNETDMKDDRVHVEDDSVIEVVMKDQKIEGGETIMREELLGKPYLKIKGAKKPAKGNEDIRNWAKDEKSLISTSLSDLKSKMSGHQNGDHVNVNKQTKQAKQTRTNYPSKEILELLEDYNSKLSFKD